MDLDQALAKHAEWKMKFRGAISKQEKMDAATIARDDCCELGKWLHGDGQRQFGKLASLGECVHKHAAFHHEAGKVAGAINHGHFAEAEAMLGAGTTYAKTSGEVGVAIMKLKKESGL